MTNVPKPELDSGAYIVYTDEPGEILSPGSTGGGGGAVVIEGIANEAGIEMQASYDDLYSLFSNGKTCVLHFADDQFSTYGMLPIVSIAHAASYKAIVLWSLTGGTTQNAEFEANSATDNFLFTFGG